MASTFYKYADRDTSAQVDWAEVGAGIAQDLKEQAAQREAQKALIEQQTRLFTQQLENNPMGEQAELNEWSMRYADSATKMMLTQEQLLKSGLLDFKDYTIQRQNLIDGTNQAYGLINAYNMEYDSALKGIEDGTISASTLEFINSVDGFRNFTASELVINPTNYKVMVGNKKKDANGNYTAELEDGFTTVNDLNNRLKKKVARYDSTPDLMAISDSMGTLSIDVRNRAKSGYTGDITSFSGIVTDFESQEWYKKMSDSDKQLYKESVARLTDAEDSRIEALMTNPDRVLSILYDDLGTTDDGKPYRLVFNDKTQTGDDIIHVTTNEQGQSQFEFTKDQKESVKYELRTRLHGMYDQEKKINPYNEASPQARGFDANAANFAAQQKATANAYDMFAMMRSGNKGDVEAGMQWLRANARNVKDGVASPVSTIHREGNRILVRFQNGEETPLYWTNSDQQFAETGLPLVGLGADRDALNKYGSWIKSSGNVVNQTDFTEGAGRTLGNFGTGATPQYGVGGFNTGVINTGQYNLNQ